MAISKRKLAVFGLGIFVGAAAVGSAWLWADASASRSSQEGKTTRAIAATAPVVAQAPQPVASCPIQPAAPVASAKDGKFVMQADVSGNAATDSASFLVVGKEAAAAGRPRDAEVAFIMACRVADQFKGAASVESADARYQLAWHYEWLAQEAGPAGGASRAELVKRADSLYSDSLKAYVARYGQDHEKSRFAADGLAALRQGSAPGRSAQRPAPVFEPPANATVARKPEEPVSPTRDGSSQPARAPLPKAQPQPRKIEVAQAAAPTVREPEAAERPRPSFDCGKARSVPEKMICSDAELARLDRELSRVHARAKNSASDSAAFNRRNNEEWRRRESTCRDRQCLLDWYAHRRSQLLGEIGPAQSLAPQRVSR